MLLLLSGHARSQADFIKFEQAGNQNSCFYLSDRCEVFILLRRTEQRTIFFSSFKHKTTTEPTIHRSPAIPVGFKLPTHQPNRDLRIINREKSKLGNMMFVQFTMYDLLLLENQIPFLVLEDIFECTIAKFDPTVSLIDVIHAVLEHVNPFKEHKLKSSSNTTHHHILGLLHECYEYQDAKSSEFSNSRFPSAIELDRAGVNFKRLRDTEWALVMEVKSRRLPCFSLSWGKPTLIMPVLDINDFTELVLRNLIAYEQFSDNVTQYITSYAMAMDMLIDTEADVAKLVESKVLVNHIGSNQEAADMMNNICKEVAWRDFFYYDQWMELNRHYNGYWSKNIAWLRRYYFNNPWNIIALFAGVFLFVLTVVQTIFTVNPAGSD